MKRVFQKIFRHTLPKVIKNSIFDVVMSCSIFDKYIFSKNIFLSCVIKISICIVIYEFELNEKCQVSLVSKYM